jgi:hypothetical protein
MREKQQPAGSDGALQAAFLVLHAAVAPGILGTRTRLATLGVRLLASVFPGGASLQLAATPHLRGTPQPEPVGKSRATTIAVRRSSRKMLKVAAEGDMCLGAALREHARLAA